LSHLIGDAELSFLHQLFSHEQRISAGRIGFALRDLSFPENHSEEKIILAKVKFLIRRNS